jgi:hypothetical protein
VTAVRAVCPASARTDLENVMVAAEPTDTTVMRAATPVRVLRLLSGAFIGVIIVGA